MFRFLAQADERTGGSTKGSTRQEFLADLKISHLVESDRGLVVGVDGGNGHRRPCGWVGQGHVVGAVRHEHPAVRHVLFGGRFVIWINLIFDFVFDQTWANCCAAVCNASLHLKM